MSRPFGPPDGLIAEIACPASLLTEAEPTGLQAVQISGIGGRPNRPPPTAPDMRVRIRRFGQV